MKLLVIDDEPLVAQVIADALESEGNQVVVAGSGDEALRVIQRDPPDGVFLDLVMPGMDGIEVLRRIRATHPDLPVIILTGWAREGQIEAARALGVLDVLQKPVAVKNLTRALVRSSRA